VSFLFNRKNIIESTLLNCINVEYISLTSTHHADEYELSSGELGEDELALTRDFNSTIHVTLTGVWPVLLAFVPLRENNIYDFTTQYDT